MANHKRKKSLLALENSPMGMLNSNSSVRDIKNSGMALHSQGIKNLNVSSDANIAKPLPIEAGSVDGTPTPGQHQHEQVMITQVDPDADVTR